MNVIPVAGEGLRNSAYLADLGDGRALTVDVLRDLRALRHRGLEHSALADAAGSIAVTPDVAVLPGGPDDWDAATGQFLEADL